MRLLMAATFANMSPYSRQMYRLFPPNVTQDYQREIVGHRQLEASWTPAATRNLDQTNVLDSPALVPDPGARPLAKVRTAKQWRIPLWRRIPTCTTPRSPYATFRYSWSQSGQLMNRPPSTACLVISLPYAVMQCLEACNYLSVTSAKSAENRKPLAGQVRAPFTRLRLSETAVQSMLNDGNEKKQRILPALRNRCLPLLGTSKLGQEVCLSRCALQSYATADFLHSCRIVFERSSLFLVQSDRKEVADEP
ncbi:hypothetical protein BDV19DRAFT_180393 [Aspergillus venezuelensis]